MQIPTACLFALKCLARLFPRLHNTNAFASLKRPFPILKIISSFCAIFNTTFLHFLAIMYYTILETKESLNLNIDNEK